MRELPEGWEIADLDLIARISTGKRDANHSNDNGKYVFFTCAQEPCLSNTYAFDDEAIILPGNGANVGCVYYYKGPFEAYQRTYVLHDIKIVQKYLYYQLLCEWRNATSGEQYGSATNYIKMGNFLNYKVPIPPLNEQKRIADRLDQLLTRIDKTKAHLDRIPPLLKRFRQSVLAAATSGKLTEEWREDNGEQDSSSKFPLDWNLKLIKEVGNVQLGRQRSPKYHSGQYMRPYLRVQNVFENFIDLDDVMEMNFPPPDMEKYRLCYGDILLNEGQSPHLLGRPAMFRDELPEAYFTNTLIRFQAFDVVSREFALLVFRNYMHCGRFQHEGTITTNIAHLGAGRFAEIEFPVPSLEEQQEIVRRVEALFTKADWIEAQYKNARQQVDRLTPALLAKAFRGELVPQDPNDEPASVLLEWVKEARSATQPAKAKRKAIK